MSANGLACCGSGLQKRSLTSVKSAHSSILGTRLRKSLTKLGIALLENMPFGSKYTVSGNGGREINPCSKCKICAFGQATFRYEAGENVMQQVGAKSLRRDLTSKAMSKSVWSLAVCLYQVVAASSAELPNRGINSV